ncbi:MAG: dihydropteroate synthase [Thermoleophilia bacterium]|nr:dihydropteroate synthase [Thermoleophilia bacterium]
MIVVGELINASRKVIAQAIRTKDVTTVQQVARDEAGAGASFIDVNAGVFEDQEAELLGWLVEHVQQTVTIPCSIDSPNPKAIEAALAVHRGDAMINSISLEQDRRDSVTSLLAGTSHHVIAMCMDDDGLPETVDQRLRNADRMVSYLRGQGVAEDHIYLDLLLQAVSSNPTAAVDFLEAVAAVKTRFPEVHLICGMSNVSFGLPQRKVLNQVFAAMAVARGLDAAILNPLDVRLMSHILVAETLAGQDEWCERYLDASRAGRLTP